MDKYTKVFFLGIGGIGMSALARYFKASGLDVFGYDKTKTDLCEELIKEGMQLIFEDNIQQIPSDFLNKEDVLFIYTPAIPSTLKIKQHLLSLELPLLKRAEVLGLISKSKKCIAVAGTHGKTSTSAILGHLFSNSTLGCTAFIGGILKNTNSNLILQPNSEYMVVEADEFDRSFLHLDVESTALTSIDADHLDIYGDANSIEETFKEYLLKVKNKTLLHSTIPLSSSFTYGLDKTANCRAHNIKWNGLEMQFDLQLFDEKAFSCFLPFPGIHNVENAVAASSLAYLEGITVKEIQNGLKSFKGVKRRFDIEYFDDNIQIDDYAHHPTEINRALESIREFYPKKEIIVIFQPHLFSRTRDFMDEFAKSLENADKAFILDIYPARELPIEGITSNILASKIKNGICLKREDIIPNLMSIKNSVIVTLGAGDISLEVPKIRSYLKTLEG